MWHVFSTCLWSSWNTVSNTTRGHELWHGTVTEDSSSMQQSRGNEVSSLPQQRPSRTLDEGIKGSFCFCQGNEWSLHFKLCFCHLNPSPDKKKHQYPAGNFGVLFLLFLPPHAHTHARAHTCTHILSLTTSTPQIVLLFYLNGILRNQLFSWYSLRASMSLELSEPGFNSWMISVKSLKAPLTSCFPFVQRQ